MVSGKYVELKISFPSELYVRFRSLCGGEKSIEQSIITLIDHCSLCESFKQCAKVNEATS
jgi:hypothetical protein